MTLTEKIVLGLTILVAVVWMTDLARETITWDRYAKEHECVILSGAPSGYVDHSHESRYTLTREYFRCGDVVVVR